MVFFSLHPENQLWLPANWLWSCRDTPRLSLASTKAPTKPMECFRPAELSLVLKPVALCLYRFLKSLVITRTWEPFSSLPRQHDSHYVLYFKALGFKHIWWISLDCYFPLKYIVNSLAWEGKVRPIGKVVDVAVLLVSWASLIHSHTGSQKGFVQ